MPLASILRILLLPSLLACAAFGAESGTGAHAHAPGKEACACAKGPLHTRQVGPRAVTRVAVAIATPPARSSRPGSTNVLYLDFNGGEVSGTEWNNDFDAVTLRCRPFDRDGDETTFDDDEQAEIIRIWERVSEDFAAFDVNVTTVDPITFSDTTGHVMIVQPLDENDVEILTPTQGGVAYVDIFGTSFNEEYSPAWVAADMDADSIADATSHEFGHNLGLDHDGWPGVDADDSEYYIGHDGAGVALSWGPIMGAPYGKTLSLWSKGEYFGSTNTEDDLAIITGKLGTVPDDHEAVAATATTVAIGGGGAVSASGVISAQVDIDAFKLVVSGPGTLVIDVEGYRDIDGTGGNLDLTVTLKDSSGTTIATSNPPASGDASINVAVVNDTYTLFVEPASAGSPMAEPPAAPTGYTSYGVLGQYTISGTVPVGPPVVVDATVHPTVGVAFTYDVIAPGATSFTAGALPPGLSMNTSGRVSGTPTTVGTTNTTVTATNSLGSDTGTIIFIVGTLPPPVVNDGTMRGNVAVVFSRATSSTGVSTGFTATGLPPGLSISGTTGIISGTPTLMGTFTTIVTGSNATASDTGTYTIVIGPAPAPPVSAADESGDDGSSCGAGGGLAALLALAGLVIVPLRRRR